MKKPIFATLIASLCAVSAPAQTLPAEADLRAHIEILASDRFQGRRPGTIGESMAGHYIAAQFAEVGLEPGNDGSFYQPVPLIERRAESSAVSFAGADGDHALAADEFIALGREGVETFDMPIVFAGFGLDFEDPNGSLANAVIEGAAVLLFSGVPEGASDDSPSFRQRRSQLAGLGAGAVIFILDDQSEWEFIQRAYGQARSRSTTDTVASVEGVVPRTAFAGIAEALGANPNDLIAAASGEGFAAMPTNVRFTGQVNTAIRTYVGQNIVGRLPGSSSSNESVLLLAHYDHLGVCRPEGAEDRICNGAVDNASGTAAIIETARALGAGDRLARDVIFLATTAEEMGLIGAHHYAENPTVPLDSIVAALNLDTIAIGPAGSPVGIVGRGMSPLDALVDEVTVEIGREVYSGTEPNAFVRRQDGWALAARGVPAIMAGGSFVDQEVLGAYLSGPYHGPEDDLGQELELGGAHEDTVLHIALGRAFADPARYSPPTR